MASEFDIIERYFAPLTMGQAGSAGLEDDAIEDALCAGTNVLENSIQNYLKS